MDTAMSPASMDAATALRTASATSSGVTLARLSQSMINFGREKVCAAKELLLACSQCAHRLDEVVRVERLGEVGVNTDLVAAFDVCFLRSGGEQHDAHSREGVVFADPSGGLPAVEPRHHHVQGDDIRCDVLDLVEAVLAVVRRMDVEAFELEVDGDELPDHFVVIDNKDPSRACAHRWRLANGRFELLTRC